MNQNDVTALMWAAYADHSNTVVSLLNHKDIEVNKEDKVREDFSCRLQIQRPGISTEDFKVTLFVCIGTDTEWQHRPNLGCRVW
jgi:ankyrin repeat protein